MIAAALWLALIVALALLLAATVSLFIQALAMTLKREKPETVAEERPSCVVLVPAHDEAGGIARAVCGLVAELGPNDRILVIADNCSDCTATLAAAAGAEVLVRTNTRLRGKGHALSDGLRHIRDNPGLSAPIVVFVDADCRFGPGGLSALVSSCARYDAPVQCRNLMVCAPDRPGKSRLSEFAWRVRNDFRPAGYARLGLPCQLFGTGMAMPARLATPDRFATGHLTEDLLIGIEAAIAGSPPRFVREASLFSYFPDTETGAAQQKKRWVQGHLAVIVSHAPTLIGLGIWRRDRQLLALGLDLLTPPLTLLAAAHLAFGLAAVLMFTFNGAKVPVLVALTGLAMFGFAMVAAWRFCGRGLIGWREIVHMPRHAIRVVLGAAGLASGKQRSAWVRADRTKLR